jgi:hypothetical protein
MSISFRSGGGRRNRDHRVDGSSCDDVAGGGQDGEVAVFKFAAGEHCLLDRDQRR